MFDTIIVGGGPAGLSAALILARSLRTVLLFDNARPRNAHASGIHGFITRDGIAPKEFIQTAHAELKQYQSITLIQKEAVGARKIEGGFEVQAEDGRCFTARKLLLATGVVDDIPKIHGILDFYGKTVHNCPYCGGYEVRGKKLAIYGKGQRGRKLSLTMLNWSPDVMLFTDGESELSSVDRARLRANGVTVVEDKITSLQGKNGQLEQIILANGNKIQRDALFFNTQSYIRSRLISQLGCRFDEDQGVPTGKYEMTEIEGLYVAGNICRDVQLVIVAAAEGAEAAFGINAALIKDSLK